MVRLKNPLCWQVESENKLMEAAVVRAVEEKHEIESQVLGLQQEVHCSRYNYLLLSPSACAFVKNSSEKSIFQALVFYSQNFQR